MIVNDKNGDDKRPSVRRLYISSRKCDPRPSYFQRDMDSGLRTPRTGEVVQVRQEAGNPHDRNAVALLKADGTVVGHVPSSFLLGSLGQQSLLTLLGP